jgi:hypothetical protein
VRLTTNAKNRATTAYVNGAMPENDWKHFVRAIDEQIARLPVLLPQTLPASAEKLVSIGQVWDGMTVSEQREAVRIIFEGIALNTREKWMCLRPAPEFEGLLAHRRELCGHGTPGRTRTCAHGLGNHCSIL